MSDGTGIEWTDATWNPTRGCSKVSEGCRNCYAMGVAARFSGPGQPYEGLARRTERGPEWTGEVRFIEDALGLPLTWRRPRRIFVDSMSDLFHPKVPFEFIAKVWTVMAEAQRHTFQILTKRPERMVEFFAWWKAQNTGDGPLLHYSNGAVGHVSYYGAHARPPPRNIWLGTSVEDQAAAEERIPHLLATPAAVRFLSCEPLLGPVNLHTPMPGPPVDGIYPPWYIQSGIDWVIVGGESGPNARPMHPAWARQLRDQCKAAGIAFFFKQWGNHVSEEHGRALGLRPGQYDGYSCVLPNGSSGPYDWALKTEGGLPNPDYREGAVITWDVGKKRAGRVLDGRTHDEFPEVP